MEMREAFEDHKTIRYKAGYKYQLHEEYTTHVPFFPYRDIHTLYIRLSMNGELHIREGYAWDGPPGPAIDTPSLMRGSLERDALHQLMRMEQLAEEQPVEIGRESYMMETRVAIDNRVIETCREDGMGLLRQGWVWVVVRWFGWASAIAGKRREVFVAPEVLLA
jgi:hypothetical protein